MSKVILFIVISSIYPAGSNVSHTQTIEMSDMDKCEFMAEHIGDILEQDLPTHIKHTEYCIVRD